MCVVKERRKRRNDNNNDNNNKIGPRALLSRGEGALGAVVRILTQPSLSVTTHGRRAYRFSLNASSAMTSTATRSIHPHSIHPRSVRPASPPSHLCTCIQISQGSTINASQFLEVCLSQIDHERFAFRRGLEKAPFLLSRRLPLPPRPGRRRQLLRPRPPRRRQLPRPRVQPRPREARSARSPMTARTKVSHAANDIPIKKKAIDHCQLSIVNCQSTRARSLSGSMDLSQMRSLSRLEVLTTLCLDDFLWPLYFSFLSDTVDDVVVGGLYGSQRVS